MKFFILIGMSLILTSLAQADKKTSDLLDKIDGQVSEIEKSIDRSEIQFSDKYERRKTLQQMRDLSHRLNSSAFELEESEDRDLFEIHMYLPRKEKGEKSVRDNLIWPKYVREDHPWFYVVPTFRGVLSEGDNFGANLGAELGFSLPLLNGIDLGLGGGSFFAQGDRIRSAGLMRVYLTRYLMGWYFAGGYGSLYENESGGFGTLGYSGYRWYAEVDFRKGQDTPTGAVLELGYRIRL